VERPFERIKRTLYQTRWLVEKTLSTKDGKVSDWISSLDRRERKRKDVKKVKEKCH